ncbi:hypothetical protein [Alkalicoccobacillus murimartini]|uniref:Uncharacterized protein n=1 Tax=Alkalicoccobacillus murimartini TaxID=171685 RepID=A0ABT9YGI5_9BACI|nr:hypothetical protein [Alkalicoccobacillus murimartini]MDQ0206626.1 hypothetical protein [Alkalicoccobacillus murimartini]
MSPKEEQRKDEQPQSEWPLLIVEIILFIPRQIVWVCKWLINLLN